MADIFLSYSQKDRARAQHMVDALNACGWTVWWDADLSSSDRFRKVIDYEIQNAKCVLVLWSKHAINSDWVVEEAEEGKVRGVLVQALIDDVSPPRGFRQIHWANLTNWAGELNEGGFETLKRGVRRFAPTPAIQSMEDASPLESAEVSQDVARPPSLPVSLNAAARGVVSPRGAAENLNSSPSNDSSQELDEPGTTIIVLGGLALFVSLGLFIFAAGLDLRSGGGMVAATVLGLAIFAGYVISKVKDAGRAPKR